MRSGSLGPLQCTVTGNASPAYEHCCVLQFSYKPKDTKLRIRLLIFLRSLAGWKSNASHLVYVLPVYLHAPLFLFSFWSMQERECKDITAPEREGGLLLWLQPTGWVLLGLNLSRMSVMLGSSTLRQMESRTTALEDTLSTSRCWNHWWLELWTGGTPQLSLHVGNQLLGHLFSRDCVKWPEHDMARKGRLRPNTLGWVELQILPVLCLHLAHDSPLQKSWAQLFSDAQYLVLPALPLWNALSDCHFIEKCPHDQCILQQ